MCVCLTFTAKALDFNVILHEQTLIPEERHSLLSIAITDISAGEPQTNPNMYV